MSKEAIKEAISNSLSFIADSLWDLFPSSPFYYIAYMLFVLALGLLFIIYFSHRKPKEELKIEIKETKKGLELEDLLKMAKSPSSTTQDLLTALLLFNTNFKVEDNFAKSMEFFKLLLNHKNAKNKKIFEVFHGQILPNNIKFKTELDKIEQEALNA